MLDDIKKIEKLDKDKVGESVSLLPDQIKQVMEENRNLKLPGGYTKFSSVVVDGMGGSNLGARIIKSVFADQLQIPLDIKAGYELPAMVSKNTFYILSSYSGTTEETLSTYKEAKSRGAKIAVLSMESPKSTLIEIAKKEKFPLITFNPKFNPCGQPRLGVGYSIAGLLTFFSKANLIKAEEKELKSIIRQMRRSDTRCVPQVKEKNNEAKKIAIKMFRKMPVLISGNFLEGNIHVLRNQISESGKNFASYLVLPELNHYSMEGLGHPKAEKKDLHFLFIDSNLENKRVQKRSELTKKVIQGEGISLSIYRPKGKTKFEQAFDVLQFGSWVSYYLGLLNNEDPAAVKWVDWFKTELSK
jgi:glucose/mannose-6-phosphate isomerase